MSRPVYYSTCLLGLDLGKNDYYYHKKGRGNGRVTADPMVLWALAHRPMPRKAKQGETAPRLPHANDIEFLAAFKGFVEACDSKSISEKTYRAKYASECYSRHTQ